MPLINFIVDMVCLLLFLSWASARFEAIAPSTVTLAGTLRKTSKPSAGRQWKILGGLLVLLLARSLAYWQMGTAANWTPTLNLGIVTLSFRNDYLARMYLFSLLSFLLVLALFYFWMLALSVVNHGVPDNDPLQRMVRQYCKWVEGWPRPLKVILPFVIGGLCWLALYPLLSRLAIVPEKRSSLQLFEQAAVVGLATYLGVKYLIVGILLLHVLHSYVFLGRHAVWNYVDVTARNLLAPMRWLPLRIGKVDLLPLLGIAAVFFITEVTTNPSVWPENMRPWYYRHVPF